MNSNTIQTSATAAAAQASPARTLVQRLFGDDGFTFKDVLDLVNPLQQIPVVGTAYRQLTGETIAPAIRIAGGALLGGPIGAALAAVGALFERSPTPQAETLVAAADSGGAGRGGWLLNAAGTGVGSVPPLVPTHEASTALAQSAPAAEPNEARRGGWLLANAYAHADLARDHLPPRFKAQA